MSQQLISKGRDQGELRGTQQSCGITKHSTHEAKRCFVCSGTNVWSDKANSTWGISCSWCHTGKLSLIALGNATTPHQYVTARSTILQFHSLHRPLKVDISSFMPLIKCQNTVFFGKTSTDFCNRLKQFAVVVLFGGGAH
jgi:hypothetical protein